jgi:hypothetical protein
VRVLGDIMSMLAEFNLVVFWSSVKTFSSVYLPRENQYDRVEYSTRWYIHFALAYGFEMTATIFHKGTIAF